MTKVIYRAESIVSLMIAVLPLSYVVLKFGGPAYSVFFVIFLMNFTQMFITTSELMRTFYRTRQSVTVGQPSMRAR